MNGRVRTARAATIIAALILGTLSSNLGVKLFAADSEKGVPHLNVSGTVKDAEGDPVSGATVSVIYRDSGGDRQIVTQSTKDDGDYDCRLASASGSEIVVVAWKDGYAAGMAKYRSRASFDPGKSPPPGATIELSLTLAPAEPLTLRIVDADGNAVSGRRVGLASLSNPDGRAGFYFSRSRLNQLTRRTDDTGRVTLDYLREGWHAGLLIETKHDGIQGFIAGPKRGDDAATVKLLRAGQIKLSLTADDPAQIRNREVTVESRPEQRASDERQPSSTITPFRGTAIVRTDDSGQATAVVAEGNVRIEVSSRPEERAFPEKVQPVSLEAGAVVDVNVPFVPGMTVHGRALTDDDKPVAGVELRVSGRTTRSDGDGRFEALIPHSQRIWANVVDVPAGYVWPYETYVQVPNVAELVAKSASSESIVELPAIRVKKAVPVQGTVVDESGTPVPQASVIAAWVQKHDEHGYFTRKSESAQSDPEGRFVLQHVLPDADVLITARTESAAVRTATDIHTDDEKTIQLQVTPNGMVDVTGQIRASDGSPIPGAQLKLSRSLIAPNGHQYGFRPMTWNGNETFSADAQGRFQTPTRVPRYSQYSLQVTADGYLAAETKFLSPPTDGPTLDFGEIPLERARTVEGVVRDTAGKPLPNVSVWSHAAPKTGRRSGSERTMTKTDAEGRFTLTQLHPRAAVAIAEAVGYRMSGGPLMSEADELTITLIRQDDPIPAEHRVRPATFDRDRRAAAVRQMLKVVLPEKRSSGYFHREAIAMLARMDRDAALAEIAQSASADTRARSLALLGEIPDALAEAESIESGYSRAFARFAILDRIDDVDQSREILAAALLDAQSIRRPDRRIVVIANVADRFFQLGDKSRAEQILRDELPQAMELSTKEWPGYARASFAERVALFDPKAALNMIREADADDHTRHFQNAAHLLAAINPDMAEAALDQIEDHRFIDSPAVRVAYRMASEDWQRAIRLLDRIDQAQRPTEKAHGLGVIAYAIKESNPSKARELLEQAFDALPQQRGETGYRGNRIFGASMTLLRFAEEIDPDRLTEYYWRTLSKYPGPDDNQWSPDKADVENAERQAQLVLVLELYDRMPGLSQRIMEPVFETWEKRMGDDSSDFTRRDATFRAMALTDPARAADWAVRFHNALDPKNRRYIPQPWEVIGNTLTKGRAAIGKSITSEVYHEWVIDKYDL